MTQKELINEISEVSKYPKATVKDVLAGLFGVVRTSLLEGKEIKIHQFGVFKSELRKPRNAYDPVKDNIIQLPETNVVKFYPSKTLKREMSE